MNEKEMKDRLNVIAVALFLVLPYIVGVYFHYNYMGKRNPSWMLWSKEYREFSESYGTKPYSDDYFIKEKNKIFERQPPRRRHPSIWKSLTYPIIPAYAIFFFVTGGVKIFASDNKDEDEDDDDEKIQS